MNDKSAVHEENSKDQDVFHRVRTAGSIVMSPELFEKLYLSPQNTASGNLSTVLASPSPLALIGFAMCVTPLSCDLMGWRGAGGSGAASTGAFFFFGGLAMVISGVMEFIIGNTFPFVVFCSFGAFWLTFATTLVPFYNAYGAYSTTESIADGLNTQGFNASFGFFLLFFGLLCLIFLVGSLRTNIAFVLVFLATTIGTGCLVGVYFHLANGNLELAQRLTIVGGAFFFMDGITGWYIVASMVLASVDFPLQIPLGDLSTIIKGASHYVRKSKIDN